MGRLRVWWRGLNSVARLRVIALAALAAGALVPLGIALASGESLMGLLLNFGTEMAGAFVTFIMFDMLIGRMEERENITYARERHKEDLIERLRSAVNDIARLAAEDLRREGWLDDGTLHRVQLATANLRGANLVGADLRGALMTRASLQNADLRTANLQDTFLRDAHLEGANLDRASLRGADLAGAALTGAILTDADLSGVNLREALLERAALDGSTFSEDTVLPDNTRWTPETDMARFTGPRRDDYWKTERELPQESRPAARRWGERDTEVTPAAPPPRPTPLSRREFGAPPADRPTPFGRGIPRTPAYPPPDPASRFGDRDRYEENLIKESEKNVFKKITLGSGTKQPSGITESPQASLYTKHWSQQRKTAGDLEVPDYRRILHRSGEPLINDEILLGKTRVIEDTLAGFGAPGKVVEVNPGPVITQFGVEPDYLLMRSGKKQRVKVGQIARLDADLARALAARSIRIEAPVPGKGFVGIEVPNDDVALVGLLDIMESPEFQRINSKLRIALGLAVDGSPVAADLTAMPHLLIAGTTGSGKSVCVNAIISCLLLSNTPDEVQFIMVDPKRVELTGYNGIPHLVAPVVVDLERIVGVLQWVQREMEERYRKFAAISARNILDYNGKLSPDQAKMPYYVVVVDELADLMMLAPDETERLLARLAQMARATGIHLIISTQRPSEDIITGLIKANFPARIAFAVASSVDSRVILDQPGAEKLLGRGDMLYQSPDAAAPLRMQGVYVSDEEINALTRYWKGLMLDKADAAGGRSSGSDDEGEVDDELYEQAVELVQRLQKASISLLHRRLRIGYTQASRLLDRMERDGIVGPQESGSKPREVIKRKDGN